MLNIKFTLSSGGGLARDIWQKLPHSQSRVLLLVLLVMGILNGLTSCHSDNIGLVLLILLGWELCLL